MAQSKPRKNQPRVRQEKQPQGSFFPKTKLRPKICAVLGSGLAHSQMNLKMPRRFRTQRIPHFPRSTAIGHAGQLVLGTVDGVAVAECKAVFICTKGYSAKQVAFPIRCARAMGAKAFHCHQRRWRYQSRLFRGRPVAIRDHINLQGANPLIGPNEDRLRPIASRI